MHYRCLTKAVRLRTPPDWGIFYSRGAFMQIDIYQSKKFEYGYLLVVEGFDVHVLTLTEGQYEKIGQHFTKIRSLDLDDGMDSWHKRWAKAIDDNGYKIVYADNASTLM